MADSSKDFQDEYLEWSVERLHVRNKSRDTGPIKRVVFTCEGPEVSASSPESSRLRAYVSYHSTGSSLLLSNQTPWSH